MKEVLLLSLPLIMDEGCHRGRKPHCYLWKLFPLSMTIKSKGINQWESYIKLLLIVDPSSLYHIRIELRGRSISFGQIEEMKRRVRSSISEISTTNGYWSLIFDIVSHQKRKGYKKNKIEFNLYEER